MLIKLDFKFLISRDIEMLLLRKLIRSFILIFFLENQFHVHSSIDSTLNLQELSCKNSSITDMSLFKRYFDAMDTIYPSHDKQQGTCLPVHKECGWPKVTNKKNLPLFVLSVGLEGAGHHLWTEILDVPLFDCVWINARHYLRDIGDGVPRTTAEKLKEGFLEMYKGRKDAQKPPCQRIYDAEDSFPTGALRKSGRVFMRPDLINLQKLDGILFNIKYLIILRNTTDTTLSALRRNFFTDLDPALRTVEHTLTYIESALRGLVCSFNQ